MNRMNTKNAARELLSIVGRFGRSTRASAVAEYTLVLAILVAGACLAYIAAAGSADRVFTIASEFRNRSSAGRASSPAAHEPSDGRPATDRPATASAQGSSSWAVQNMSIMLGTGAWVATMACGLVLLRIIRGRSKGARAAAAAVEEPIVPVLESTSYDRLVEKRQQICRLVTRDAENPGGVQTRVRHLMSRHVATVPPETPLAEAMGTMTDQGIRHLLVCEKGGRLVGIISDRDVKNRAGVAVTDIMTAKPVVVPPDMAVGPAITLMLSHSISCLPVVDHDRLCGVLTTTDVMLSCQCMLQVMEKIASGLCLTDPSVGNRISEATWDENPRAMADDVNLEPVSS